MSISQKVFREALGRFASGVTVVTGIRPDGGFAGVTASAFTSVSMDPPLISICLSIDTACLSAFVDGNSFAINILAEDQKDISENFARRSNDKFKGIEYRIGNNGCPLFPGCLAAIECVLEAVHDAGDHKLIIGRIDRLEHADLKPLIHFRGDYWSLGRELS